MVQMEDMQDSFGAKAAAWDSPDKLKRAAILAEKISTHFIFQKTDRLLDFGSGTGLLGLLFAEKVGYVTLVDTSEGMISVLKQKISDGMIANAAALRVDIEEDPDFTGPFSYIVTSLALHHVRGIDAILLRFKELLEPAGKLVLIDLEPEDGSFHGPDFNGYLGFDRVELGRKLSALGFRVSANETVLNIKKDGNRYPLFMIVAELQ